MIDKLVISTSNHDQMVRFYATLLSIEFADIPFGDSNLSAGERDGFTLMLCPASISGVISEVNNIQPRFRVVDLHEARSRGLAEGGTPISEVAVIEGDFQAWDIRDPDGNSLELVANAPRDTR